MRGRQLNSARERGQAGSKAKKGPHKSTNGSVLLIFHPCHFADISRIHCCCQICFFLFHGATFCNCRVLVAHQGVHVLYTGDYSMEADRHLMAAEMPSTSPDVLIVESTYGVQVLFALARV